MIKVNNHQPIIRVPVSSNNLSHLDALTILSFPFSTQIGAARVKRADIAIEHDRLQSGLPTKVTRVDSNSNTVLASLCNSKYTRNKRKYDLKEGNDILSKVLTIDEDVKKKNSQRKFDDFDSSVLKESNAGFVLYASSLFDSLH